MQNHALSNSTLLDIQAWKLETHVQTPAMTRFTLLTFVSLYPPAFSSGGVLAVSVTGESVLVVMDLTRTIGTYLVGENLAQ